MKRKMTGADYLLRAASAAEDAVDEDHDDGFVTLFNMMVTSYCSPDDPVLPGMPSWMGRTLSELVAKRPLNAHEAAPVSIIYSAASAAHHSRDARALDEVFRVGLALLAKWPTYLTSLYAENDQGEDQHGMHPDLRARD